ncbi:hypothetical protein DM860_010586 [Cuscuta australis]|uniref:Nuclear pore protein n=1 Tax=Cuscuta australis TaxID=267555 RepID=A0A328E5G5_9ASTE|nr:hypothetical protein DM860_010586 [Cuscuta australis]
MANDADMSSWSELLHTSSKLIEQTAPSALFPPLQRNLDQVEALSKKLKAKTLRGETPYQSLAATRLLAREGINAEQLANDLKSFELKACPSNTTFEDVFPIEATTVEEYLQQIHEMAMVSAVQEAQKDNLKNFNDYMMSVLEEDWQKEKRNFLQSLNRMSTLPRANISESSPGNARQRQLVSLNYSPQPATAFKHACESLGLDTSGGKSVSMQKIWHLVLALMGEDATKRNVSRKISLVMGARRHLEYGHEKYILDTIQSHPVQAALGGAVGNLQRIHAFLRIRLRDYGVLDFDATDAFRQPPVDTTWQQVARMPRPHWSWCPPSISPDLAGKRSDPPKTAGGSERFPAKSGEIDGGHQLQCSRGIRATSKDPSIARFDEDLQNPQFWIQFRILGFFRVEKFRFEKLQAKLDKMIYFCLRTGYYDEAREVAQQSRASQQFAVLLREWISTGGQVSTETAAAASEECEKILRLGDRIGRTSYDKKKLLLYAIVSGSRRQIDRLLRELPTLFNTIEDFLWFTLSVVRESPGRLDVLNEGLSPYSLDDLQAYLNKFEPSHYTKNGKDPLVYPYVLLLSIQLLPAVLYLSKDMGDEGYNVDAVHISVVFADHGVLSEAGQTVGVMDAFAEVSSIIRQYGSLYLRHSDLSAALEYYVQASAAVGGGQLSWSGRANVDQQRQRNLMLKQLLIELLLRDGGIYLLLGSRGDGDEGQLGIFLTDRKTRQSFLHEAARHCQDAGLYDKCIEIQKRVGAFSAALDTVNKCLSDAICALSRGRLEGESQTSALIHSGNEILETFKYYPDISSQEREMALEQQTVLRQLEAVLSIHKLARLGSHMDALKEVAKLPFLPLDPRTPGIATDVFQNLSPNVQACVPDLLKVALHCLENVRDTDGSLRALREKIANFLANNLGRNWPRDLYEKVAQQL